MEQLTDTWSSSNPYEYFMGRWSQKMAPVFLQWLQFPGGKSWLDLGCGTGALSKAIFDLCHPASITGVDPSPDFLSVASKKITTGHFLVGSSSDIPVSDGRFDIVVSGLAFNFFPDISESVKEIKRVLKKNGTIALYVWDYAGKMEFLRFFWDAANEVELAGLQFDEGIRFPVCNSLKLEQSFSKAGLKNVESSFLDIQTVFKNFDDYWQPFLGGQGPAPTYLSSLEQEKQERIKELLKSKLPMGADNSIKLLARAIAVRGNI
jgi:ubiquinone/menaquinone biosynthesis C-methylase UbiE